MEPGKWKIGKLIFLYGVFLFLIPTLGFSEEFPTKPINLLVGFSPGQTVDVSARLLAGNAEKFLGQPIVVSNNGGGAGSVALGIAAKLKPDGYNLVCVAASSLMLIPQFRPVPYKYEDFVPIMHYAIPQAGLVVKADSPWKTLKELVEYARKNPGKFNYTSKGSGQPQHLAMEYIAKQEGIQWTLVPSPSTAPLIPVLGGHVGAYSGGTGWVPYVKSGSLRLLAVYGERRMKNFPEVPTLRELGYDWVHNDVFMLVAPKRTPISIVNKLDDALRKAMDNSEFLHYMEKVELDAGYRNSENTKKFLDETYPVYQKLIKELKIKGEEK